MYNNEVISPNIKINLKNGIYQFDCESGDGKTRLYKALRDYMANGEPVVSYSYGDKIAGLTIDKVLVPDKYKVILLDRYDMYNGDGAELIDECSKNSIILIDCKGVLEVPMETYRKVHMCSMLMWKNKLEVF